MSEYEIRVYGHHRDGIEFFYSVMLFNGNRMWQSTDFLSDRAAMKAGEKAARAHKEARAPHRFIASKTLT
jgi:hypothetical protein